MCVELYGYRDLMIQEKREQVRLQNAELDPGAVTLSIHVTHTAPPK